MNATTVSMVPSRAVQQRRVDLEAALSTGPATKAAICAAYGWTPGQMAEALFHLRRQLITDPRNVVGEWRNGEYVYFLTGDLDDARGWTTNRVGDTETRVRTMQAVMESVVVATNGRTRTGQKARIIERSFKRLVEDLDTVGTLIGP